MLQKRPCTASATRANDSNVPPGGGSGGGRGGGGDGGFDGGGGLGGGGGCKTLSTEKPHLSEVVKNSLTVQNRVVWFVLLATCGV